MAKFCMNCGAQLEDNAKFCMSCGTKVEEMAVPAAASSAETAATPAAAPVSYPGPAIPKKKGKTGLIIGIAVGVVALIAVLAVLLGGSGGASKLYGAMPWMLQW